MNVAVNLKVCLFELGLSSDSQFRPLGHSVDGEVAGALLIEGKIVEHGWPHSAWAASTVPEPSAVKSARPVTAMRALCSIGDAGQIKIVALQVETEGLARRVE